MQMDYILDKDKFIKVYNELKLDNDGTIMDNYNLLDKYDVTKDGTLKDMMFAINNNISFHITSIEEIKKIEDMYSHYENPNRLTKGEIIDCIMEIDHVSIGLGFSGSFIKEVNLLKTPNNTDVFMLINVYGENIAIVKPAGKLSEVVELAQQEYNKAQKQDIIHHNPESRGFFSIIKRWFS
jgi:hypothetical protein